MFLPSALTASHRATAHRPFQPMRLWCTRIRTLSSSTWQIVGWRTKNCWIKMEFEMQTRIAKIIPTNRDIGSLSANVLHHHVTHIWPDNLASPMNGMSRCGSCPPPPPDTVVLFLPRPLFAQFLLRRHFRVLAIQFDRLCLKKQLHNWISISFIIQQATFIHNCSPHLSCLFLAAIVPFPPLVFFTSLLLLLLLFIHPQLLFITFS